MNDKPPYDIVFDATEIGARIQSMDWSKNALGPIESWSPILQNTVRLCLASSFPLAIVWGPERIHIYNDAYGRIHGANHPHTIGQDFKAAWLSAWPAMDEALARASLGETTFRAKERLLLERNGDLEETFFTFSFSPIRDESGHVVGLFHPIVEVTQQVVAERRWEILRELVDRTIAVQTFDAAARRIEEVLGGHDLDVPLALLYRLDPDRRFATLAVKVGILADSSIAPRTVDLLVPSPGGWPLAESVRDRDLVEVNDVADRFGPLDGASSTESPRRALVLPIEHATIESNHPLALLVVGVSRHRPLDDAYRSFYRSMRRTITHILVHAHVHEADRREVNARTLLERNQAAFLTDLSHEFRSPLTLMLGPVEHMLEQPDADLTPAAKGQLEIVHRNSIRILKLVNTMLDFARVEAGRAGVRYQRFDLAAYTADLVSTFRAAIERAGLRFIVRCPSSSAPTYVDRELWERIVLNLLSNAFRFTQDGEIEVRVEAQDGRVNLLIRDTGVGIPPEEIPRIFEPFHRVKDTRGRTSEGTGLGLALVQELVKLHGGSIRVESVLHEGSQFIVSLPLGTDHLDPAHICETTEPGPRNPRVEVFGDEKFVDPPSKPSRSPATRARVVWADDNADMREYVRRLLSERFQVEAVADGYAALEAVRAQPTDLVLSDVMMPRMDGFGLLRGLRADPQLQGIPMVLVSARAGDDARIEGWEAGADDYVVKPFGARELLARVESHVRNGRRRREAATNVSDPNDLRLGTDAARLQRIIDTAPAFTWIGESSGFRSFLSRGWCAYTGQTEAQAAGYGWLDAVHPDDREQARGIGARDHAPQHSFVSDYRVRRADGAYRWAMDTEKLRFSDRGDILGSIGSVIDAHDHNVAGEELRRTNADLRIADRRKDEFLATLAHELRNPLAPIRNATELLRMAGGDRELAKHALSIMDRQLDHMVHLLDDLMDLSRISGGKVAPRKQSVELAFILQNVIEAMRPVIAEVGHELSIALPNEPIILNADATRLAQVFSNLLSNAAKYTERGGRIWLSAERRGDEVVVTIRDSGIGISAEHLPQIFSLFWQVPESLDRSEGGLGIGLALVKGLVELHGGTVEARSDGLGRGSEFMVRLPILAPLDGGSDRNPRAWGGEMVRIPVRVLIVDDDRDNALSLAMLLRVKGHDVETAHDGFSALRLSETFRPRLVLLDIGLPTMSGHDVAQLMRQQTWGRTSVLVAVTGWGQDEDKLRSIAAGFDHHMTKPVDPRALDALLAGLARD